MLQLDFPITVSFPSHSVVLLTVTYGKEMQPWEIYVSVWPSYPDLITHIPM